MLLLKQDIIINKQVNTLLEVELEQKLHIRDYKKYQVEAICNSEVYAKEAIS